MRTEKKSEIIKAIKQVYIIIIIGCTLLASLFFVWNGFNTMGWIFFLLFIAIIIEFHFVNWFNNTHRENKITGKYHKVLK